MLILIMQGKTVQVKRCLHFLNLKIKIKAVILIQDHQVSRALKAAQGRATINQMKQIKHRIMISTTLPPTSPVNDFPHTHICGYMYMYMCILYIQGVPKKCPIAIFSLNLFQRCDYTFSHVFRNQNFEPISSKHIKHTHSEY